MTNLTLLWRIPRTAGVSLEVGLKKLGVIVATPAALIPVREEALGPPVAEADYVSCQHALPSQVAARSVFTEAEICNATNLLCVRNPWDRAVSLFSLLRRQGWQRPKREHWRHAGDDRFAEYIDWATSQGSSVEDPSDIFQGKPSVHWLFIKERRVPFRVLGRFEQLEDYWHAVCDIFGVRGDMPRINTTVHKPYREMYTPELRDKVAKFYAAEIEEFGYEF